MRDELKSAECAKYLKALADPERLKIVQCLERGPIRVGDIAKLVDRSVANVSHHLKALRLSGLVNGHRRGRFVFYEIHPRVSRHARGGLPVLEFGCCRIELG